MSNDIKTPWYNNYDPFKEHEAHFGVLPRERSTIVNKTEVITTTDENEDTYTTFTSRKIVHTQTIITTSPYEETILLEETK